MSAVLKITRSIDNDIWKITFRLDPANFSVSDEQLIARFGEPEINVGGVVGGLAIQNGETSYTLPEKYIKIRSGLPYTQEFDSRIAPFNTDTRKKAEAYQAAFIARYNQTLADLRANSLYSAELLSVLEYIDNPDNSLEVPPVLTPQAASIGGGNQSEIPFSGESDCLVNLN